MTKIKDFHAAREAERLAKKAELDPSRTPEFSIPVSKDKSNRSNKGADKGKDKGKSKGKK